MVLAPVIVQHEGTKGTKLHEAHQHPPKNEGWGVALYSFVSFVPSW
jgi:hypothetical protein